LVVGGWLRWAGRRIATVVVEGDAELNLDFPSGDSDLVDDEAEQGLFLLEVEVVDDCEHALSEAGDAVA
jgi:hypothetical protein